MSNKGFVETLILLTAVTVLAPAGAPAQTAARAWIWADQPTAKSYTPHHSYQYSSSGGVSRAGRLGAGSYRVELPGLGGGGGVVHVSAYAGSHFCKVANWRPSGSALEIRVLCFDPGGSPADGRFTVLFYRETRGDDRDAAYLWADQPTAPSYVPSLAYQWSSKSLAKANTVRRQEAGRYQARLPGMSRPGGTVLVTAYGSGPERCKAASWRRSGDDTLVDVRCFDAKGQPADARYTLSFMTDVGLGARTGEEAPAGGYVWADRPMAESYTPSRTYQLNDAGEVNTAGRLLPGTYRVRFPGLSPRDRTTALATAYGTSSEHCTVNRWVGDGAAGTNVYVTCFDAAGNPADTRFTVLYLTDDGEDVGRGVVLADSPSRLALSQLIYADGDPAAATLDVGEGFLRAPLVPVALVSAETGDLEVLTLERADGSGRRFETREPVPIRAPPPGGRVEQLNGTLVAAPGEIVVALYYPDDAQEPDLGGDAQIVTDFGVVEQPLPPGTPAPEVLEPLAMSDDELDAGAAGKRLGTLLADGGRPLQVAVDELVVESADEDELNRFLELTGGRVVSSDALPGAQREPRSYLVRVDATLRHRRELPQLLSLMGLEQRLYGSNEEVLQLVALALHARLEGFDVTVNPRLQWTACRDRPKIPATRSPRRSARPSASTGPGPTPPSSSSTKPESTSRSSTRASRRTRISAAFPTASRSATWNRAATVWASPAAPTPPRVLPRWGPASSVRPPGTAT